MFISITPSPFGLPRWHLTCSNALLAGRGRTSSQCANPKSCKRFAQLSQMVGEKKHSKCFLFSICPGCTLHHPKLEIFAQLQAQLPIWSCNGFSVCHPIPFLLSARCTTQIAIPFTSPLLLCRLRIFRNLYGFLLYFPGHRLLAFPIGCDWWDHLRGRPFPFAFAQILQNLPTHTSTKTMIDLLRNISFV